MERERERLKKKCAERNRLRKEALDAAHKDEAESIGVEDPAMLQQMLLRQSHETKLQEIEANSFENDTDAHIVDLEKTTLDNISMLESNELLKTFNESAAQVEKRTLERRDADTKRLL